MERIIYVKHIFEAMPFFAIVEKYKRNSQTHTPLIIYKQSESADKYRAKPHGRHRKENSCRNQFTSHRKQAQYHAIYHFIIDKIPRYTHYYKQNRITNAKRRREENFNYSPYRAKTVFL